jgi:porphyrinogen peroxidase
MPPQLGILDGVPAVGRHLTFDLRWAADPHEALRRLRQAASETCVIGLGAPLANVLDATIEGLRVFPAFAGRGVHTPSTQNALWVWVREQDPSHAFDQARTVHQLLGDDFTLVEEITTFIYRGGRDLSGYEDGTENPKGEQAVAAAIVGSGPLAGSSFAAVQRWIHDLRRFTSLQALDRDNIFGRRQSDNQELDDAPVSAHIRRSAQEDYDPPAFMVRRSMPWSEGGQQGLYFVAFGESPGRYERVLHRMVGIEDGVVDGLFAFTRPATGGYFWCPPQNGGRIDLTAVGI